MKPAIGLLCVLFAAPLSAQRIASPGTTWLEWTNLSIAMVPDSAGVYLWVNGRANKANNSRAFDGILRPSRITEWATAVRAFLAARPTDSDTGTMRTSPILYEVGGGGFYIARRRVDGKWSPDFVLIGEKLRSGPLAFAADAPSVGEIIDSLVAVARRTPFVPGRFEADSAAIAIGSDVDKPVTARGDGAGPVYPVDLLREQTGGFVLVSFFVDVDGRIELPTVKGLYWTNDAFLRAVIDAIPYMRFNPAIRAGAPVRQHVQMPFEFSVVKR